MKGRGFFDGLVRARLIGLEQERLAQAIRRRLAEEERQQKRS